MRNKIIFFGIAALILASTAAAFFVTRAPADDGQGTDFNQIGNLIYNNPGLTPDTWYLVYDQPGKPGISTQLQFDSASACAVGTPAAPCDPSKLEQGTQVRIEGVRSGNAVLVRTIQSPETPPMVIVLTQTSTSTGSTTKTTTSTASTTKPKTSTSTPPTNGTSSVPSAGSTATSTASTTSSSNTGLVVKLYFYDSALDQGPSGTQCTSKGLLAVERVIPRTSTPLTDAINLLLRGQITDQERKQGITSEFPLSGVSLTNTSVRGDTLTLTFRDPNHATSGGACRTSIMWGEIQSTALQFAGIKKVQFTPKNLFQP